MFDDENLNRAYDEGKRLLAAAEKRYLEHVSSIGKKLSDVGVFRARLFGLNFAVSALVLAESEQRRDYHQSVYLELLKEAKKDLAITDRDVHSVSTSVLKEQTRALNAERRNVGSGQFALAALYEQALECSLGSLMTAGDKFSEPLPHILGRLVGEYLAVWSGLFNQMSGGTMQVYDQGFAKTEKDANPFKQKDE